MTISIIESVTIYKTRFFGQLEVIENASNLYLTMKRNIYVSLA